MAEGRHRDGAPKSTRNRDRWLALLIVVLAAVGGALAGHFGTPKSWEHPAPGTPGGPKAQSVQSQGSR